MKYSIGDLVVMTREARNERPYKSRVCKYGVVLPFSNEECGTFYKNKYKVYWWPYNGLFITKIEDLKILSPR